MSTRVKYPNMPQLDEVPIAVREALFEDSYEFEKLDGGNVQVDMREEVITYGLRSGYLDGGRAPWVEELNKWYWTSRERIHELPPGIYYGEFLAPHTIEYKPEYVNKFVLIDVFDDGEFMDYEAGYERVRQHGLEDIMLKAPVLHKGKVTMEEILAMINGKSEFSVNGEREGVVIKDYTTQTFVKAKHPKFISNPSLGNDDSEK